MRLPGVLHSQMAQEAWSDLRRGSARPGLLPARSLWPVLPAPCPQPSWPRRSCLPGNAAQCRVGRVPPLLPHGWWREFQPLWISAFMGGSPGDIPEAPSAGWG